MHIALELLIETSSTTYIALRPYMQMPNVRIFTKCDTPKIIAEPSVFSTPATANRSATSKPTTM